MRATWLDAITHPRPPANNNSTQTEPPNPSTPLHKLTMRAHSPHRLRSSERHLPPALTQKRQSPPPHPVYEQYLESGTAGSYTSLEGYSRQMGGTQEDGGFRHQRHHLRWRPQPTRTGPITRHHFPTRQRSCRSRRPHQTPAYCAPRCESVRSLHPDYSRAHRLALDPFGH